MHGGGWANKGHFKKWYKKAFHGILDMMLLQSWISWHLAVSEHASEAANNATTARWKASLKKEEFNILITVEMMTYIDSDGGDTEGAGNDQDTALLQYEQGHHPMALPTQPTGPNKHQPRFRCLVCSLENCV
jgi:hypothetical protein